MDMSLVIVSVLVGLALVISANGQCALPQAPNGTAQVGEVLNSYEENDVITYSCDSDVDGYYGAIYIRCQRSKDTLAYSWSDPDRHCDEVVSVGGGSISGICIAVANVSVAVTFIIYTKCFFHSKSSGN